MAILTGMDPTPMVVVTVLVAVLITVTEFAPFTQILRTLSTFAVY
jgi:hypothetical protein